MSDPVRQHLEVQIHPADLRKRVRSLFLSRGELTAWSLLGLGYLLFLAFAAALAPGVLRGLLSGQEYQSLIAERRSQGARVQELAGRLEELAERGERLQRQLARIRLAYGLGTEPAGGERMAAAAVPAAPRSIYAGTIDSARRLLGRTSRELASFARQLGEVQAFERANPELVRTTPSACPLRGGELVLTSSFARRRSPFTKEVAFHPGLDLAAPLGTQVHAPAEGVVAFAGQYPLGRSADWWRFGNLVILRHGERFVTVYGHCDRVSVRPGQRVARGEAIATVGSTGWSTHPHLHYEVRLLGAPGGRPVDPRLFILDYRWPNEDRLLIDARRGVAPAGVEPLPPLGVSVRRRRR